MSVLIKDMEIPETCDDCPFHVYHSHHEYVCEATPMFYPMNLANSKGIRKDWCPLSEVSEPCKDAVSREAMRDEIDKLIKIYFDESMVLTKVKQALFNLPSAQSEYEELTPEEAASEIASGSIMSTWHWLGVMVQLKQMGYAICRKAGYPITEAEREYIANDVLAVKKAMEQMRKEGDE